MSDVHLEPQSLPVLRAVDVVVVGGSIAAVAAALAAAEDGASVCVVESSTYLGHEVTGLLRHWVSARDLQRGDHYGIIDALAATDAAGVEHPIWPAAAKRGLENLLEAAEVSLLYGSRGVDLHRGLERTEGVVIANKAGRQLILGEQVLVSPESAGALQMSRPGGEPEPTWFTLSMTGVRRSQGGADRQVAAGLDLGGRVRLHPGHLGSHHVLVEACLQAAATSPVVGSPTDRARRAAVRVFEYLRTTDPDFADAWLGGISYRAHCPRPSPTDLPDAVEVLDDPSRWLALLGADDDRHTDLSGLIEEAAARGRLAASRVTSARPIREHRSARAVSSRCHHPVPSGLDRRPSSGLTITDVRDVDVLIVGGGSSGASCAVAVALEGATCILADLNPGLGGTGTFGGVDSYWFGRRDGLAAPTRQRVKDAHHTLGINAGAGRGWNIDLKADALLDAVHAAGASVMTDSIAFSAIVEDGRVVGVTFATERGPVAVRARVVIDATGDADIAAAAGATVRMGAERTHAAMWYSLAQFTEPGRSRNNFGGVVDLADVEDLTRAVISGRRRGAADLHDHGIYVAARESRNIDGDATVSLTDQLVRRHYEDVINVHFSNHDIKGRSESIWTLMGLIPPNLEIEIPYRALLPRGLDGLLVVGKAISTTHDGLAAVRMQSDLENLGAVAGIIAATCARHGSTPRTVDLPRVQQGLVARGAFPPERLQLSPGPQYGRYSVAELIDRTLAQVPLYTYAAGGMRHIHSEGIPFVDLILRPDPQINDSVAAAMRTADPVGAMVLARILVCRGDQRGAEAIIAELERVLTTRTTLPERTSEIRHVQLPPDQAAMPDEAYLLYTLGIARTSQTVPLWELVAERIEATPQAMRSMTAGTFAYAHAVIYGAERLGDPAARPALKTLHAHDALRHQVRTHVTDHDIFQERQAMLELGIGSALARCGDLDGLRLLATYLADARGPLRRQARTELSLLRGADLGPRAERWQEWIERTSHWTPQPLPPSSDLYAMDGLQHGPGPSTPSAWVEEPATPAQPSMQGTH